MGQGEGDTTLNKIATAIDNKAPTSQFLTDWGFFYATERELEK